MNATSSFMRWVERASVEANTTVAGRVVGASLRLLAVSDALLGAYLVLMLSIVALIGSGEGAARSTRQLAISIAALAAACLVGRAPSKLPWIARVAAYRTTLVAVVLGSYLMLRDLLPAVRPDDVDPQLLALDLRLFGVEPTLWVERYTTASVVEYFAFFYFSYFTICALFTAAVVAFNVAREATSEFAIGCVLVFCIGQLGYVAVPARGPIHHLAAQFQEPLRGGMFFEWVLQTVAAGGAMKDVFPSLHTAAPVWFALFAIRRARLTRAPGWVAVAAVTSFFAANIMASTVILRWHYLVDVIAGFALAAFAASAAPRLAEWERRRRAARGLEPAWATPGLARRLSDARA